MPPIMENPALERDSEIVRRTAAMNLGDLRNDYQVDKANRKKQLQNQKMGKLVNFLGGDLE